MSDREAFVRAICADPTDDTARLVYADWLDEHDEPERAEFIRLQILLHHTSFIRAGGARSIWPEPWCSRIKRAGELADRYGRQWSGAGDMPLTDREFAAFYRRGFAWTITGRALDVFERLERIFARHPVTWVGIAGGMPERTTPAQGHYRWRRDPKYRDSASLPPVIFDLLPEPQRERGWKYASDACKALSDALVAHGRELVGLPALVTEAVTA